MYWLIFSVLLWGGLHSMLASNKAKELAAGWFWGRLRQAYRLAYNLFAGLSFLPVLVMAVVLPDRILYKVPLPWSVIMAAGELVATAALVIGFRQTDVGEFLGLRQLTGGAASRYSDGSVESSRGRLVTAGLYRYVRHPLYTAGLVFIWLLPLMTANALAINIGLTIYVIAGASLEERKLRSEYGQEYADYAAVTPMFIPFIKGNKKRNKTPL
jgi:methanethiol S-methyltransferase